MKRECVDCGVPFEPNRRGRPRIRCRGCSPVQRSARARAQIPCSQCESAFAPKVANQRFCSATCREAWIAESGYVSPSSLGTCAGCGVEIRTSKTSSAAEPRCRPCRNALVQHGDLAMYDKRGCRCSPCRQAKADANREYVERCGYRMERRDCAECGAEFEARKSSPTRFCGLSCANESRRGLVPSRRFRIRDRDRLAIYERDGWTCLLCDEPVEREADYLTDWAPTLDHIVPRSLGGSDDPENLRTAHRWCNSVRGDLSFYTDEDLREVA